MCQELRRRRFDIIYANMIDNDDCKPRLKFWQKSNLNAYIMNLTDVPNKHQNEQKKGEMLEMKIDPIDQGKRSWKNAGGH